ncbi:MAG: tRNA preQ1(34) S-adenosylmethionine ribosyltransferase-isomerase QueA [Planctomycetota bacterium]
MTSTGPDDRLRTAHFDFELPDELIAREPLAERDGSRLLVLPRDAGDPEHASVRDLPGLLREGDLVVLNDTRVLAARIRVHRASGGRAEFLLHDPASTPAATDGAADWWAFARPAKRLRAGERLVCDSDPGYSVEAVERSAETGHWRVRLLAAGVPVGPDGFGRALDAVGEVPLPPYIDREVRPDDRERYQTVYAARPGAVAAPTAGLHFTDALLAELDGRGVERAFVTLHVGAGTFLPVTADHVEEHRMHAEVYELPGETADAVARCRARDGRVVAVGTTSARVLESCADGDGGVRAGSGSTEIFLHPGSPPRVVDGLFTNFHLPKSTLVMLVSSLAGVDRVLGAYREAVRERYRFYSYGDAMLIL